MYGITEKRQLAPSVFLMKILAPRIASGAEPGQFVILRAAEGGERIPLTIAGYDRGEGSVTVIFQAVGASTDKLARLEAGGAVRDIAGPLGNPSELGGLRKALFVSGGTGCAAALAAAAKLRSAGACVHAVNGFRSADSVLLGDEFGRLCDRYILMTEDGTAGRKGLVTDALEELLEAGETYDRVTASGPLAMMEAVCRLTASRGIETRVNMNPIMIDGTGMCGGCRLTVGGETKFACIDGPEFDGHLVDFGEALRRGRVYSDFEKRAREKNCGLFGKEAGL